MLWLIGNKWKSKSISKTLIFPTEFQLNISREFQHTALSKTIYQMIYEIFYQDFADGHSLIRLFDDAKFVAKTWNFTTLMFNIYKKIKKESSLL